MKLRKHQRGIGMWGWLMILGLIGFFSVIFTKSSPLYLNEMSVKRIVSSTAKDGGSLVEMRKAMEKRWVIDNVSVITPNDIKMVAKPGGRFLTYDYEARAELFTDIYLVFRFHNEFPLSGGGGSLE